MSYISKETADEIKRSADLLKAIESITPLTKRGKDYAGECPMCHKKDGLKVDARKSIFKCFSCDFGGNNAVQYVMNATGKNYQEALRYLADHFNVTIIEEPHKERGLKATAREDSFKNRQLKESGLDIKDVRAMELIDDHSSKSLNVFEAAKDKRSGTEYITIANRWFDTDE